MIFAATWAVLLTLVVLASASGALRLLPDVPAPFASGCVSDAPVDALPEKKDLSPCSNTPKNLGVLRDLNLTD